jgi:hypothetical protein
MLREGTDFFLKLADHNPHSVKRKKPAGLNLSAGNAEISCRDRGDLALFHD